MVKTTYVRFVTTYQEANNVSLVCLRTMSSHKVSCLFVESFEGGFATVQPPKGTYIHDFAEIIVGCLMENSNFPFEVLSGFNHDVCDTFNGIKFKFNNVTITLTRKDTDSDEICKRWEQKSIVAINENPSVCIIQQNGRLSIVDEVLYIDRTTKMEFKNEYAKRYWENLVKFSSEFSEGHAILTYARLWAKYMQNLMAKGKMLNEIAKDSSYICDLEGISVHMYICALKILFATWKYGNYLENWYKANPCLY